MADKKDEKKNMLDADGISSKLSAPKKTSAFERQKQEAEAKRLREEEETSRALREFEDSFAAGDDDEFEDPIAALAAGRGLGLSNAPAGPRASSSALGSHGGATGPGSSGARRHFGGPGVMRKSGPGTLGPVPAPPMSYREKRAREEERERNGRSSGGGGGGGGRGNRGGYGSDYSGYSGRRSSSEAEERRRPTMLLANLPNITKEDDIKNYLSATLKVDEVTFVAPSRYAPADSRRLTAIVAVVHNTKGSEVDSVVAALQGKYLGFGCYLKISRHVTTSGSLLSTIHSIVPAQEIHPYGAKPFFGPQAASRGPNPLVVTVTPPEDLKVLRAIHKTVEKVLAYGPAFEERLMTDAAIQHDEHWAWLWDTRSPAHVYYRWAVWELRSAIQAHDAELFALGGGVMSTAEQSMMKQQNLKRTPEDGVASQYGLVRIFGNGPLWQPPQHRPRFEFATDIEQLVEDPGYVSSDDENEGDEGANVNYLNPYRRARLTWELSRLPDNIANLRTGDIARITDFVVRNAGNGAEEIVEMLMQNVKTPFCHAVEYKKYASDDEMRDSDHDYNDDDDDEDKSRALDHDKDYDSDPDLLHPSAGLGMGGLGFGNDDAEERATNVPGTNPVYPAAKASPPRDESNAKLIGIYAISDIIKVAGVSGVSGAWKFRTLFEAALRRHHIFAHLGRLDQRYAWGRIKAEQWKRKVDVVLRHWETKAVVSVECHKACQEEFYNAADRDARDAQHDKERRGSKDVEERKPGKWMDISSSGSDAASASASRSVTPAATSAGGNINNNNQQKLSTFSTTPAPTTATAASPQSQPARRVPGARPRAEDFISSGPEPTPPPPPKPAIALGGFSMSLAGVGGGGGGGGEKKREGSAEPGPGNGGSSAASGATFSLGGAKRGADFDDDDDEVPKPKKRLAAAVEALFGDSDDDMHG